MNRKIIILSVFVMRIVNITNTINYRNNNIEITNKNGTNQNIKFESVNFSVPDIYDVISIDTTVFNNCTVEFWFEAMAMKKKLKIGYDAWTNYFGPMIQKIDAYIFKHPVSSISAGQIKIGLINMFSEVIKHNFWRGGNDVDRNDPYWDGYQIAASYMIKNKEYLNTFFNEKGIDSILKRNIEVITTFSIKNNWRH